MLPVFNQQGETCSGEWEFAGLRTGVDFVTAVIKNTKGTPLQEYSYDEQSLLLQIERIKMLSPSMEAAHKVSILHAGLLAVRKYKFEHGVGPLQMYASN